MKEWHFYRQFGIYLHECVFQKVSKLHELAIFPLANFKVSNGRFLHLIAYQPIKVLHSLTYLHFVSLFLHYVSSFLHSLSRSDSRNLFMYIIRK